MKYLTFTDRGQALAERLSQALGGQVSRFTPGFSMDDWTATGFQRRENLVFIGAVGIAVRAIAPHVRSKVTDPAVVAVDESGTFAVPVLSGHLGGANDLARRIAAVCGAVPVVTTATDCRGVFAVDEWTKRQNCTILNPERIKLVSGKLLSGKTVACRSDFPIQGAPPQGVELVREGPCDIRLSLMAEEDQDSLRAVPQIGVLGVGCKKGIAPEQIEGLFQTLLRRTGIAPQAIVKVCSLDLKAREPGLLAFCAAHGWDLETFSAYALGQVEGEFSSSAFVEKTVGVDNVCERAAVLGSGGKLLCKKIAEAGVTMALATQVYTPDWRWRDA